MGAGQGVGLPVGASNFLGPVNPIGVASQCVDADLGAQCNAKSQQEFDVSTTAPIAPRDIPQRDGRFSARKHHARGLKGLSARGDLGRYTRQYFADIARFAFDGIAQNVGVIAGLAGERRGCFQALLGRCNDSGLYAGHSGVIGFDGFACTAVEPLARRVR